MFYNCSPKKKNYLLFLFVLLFVACGAYLWANSLSEKERLELLDGEYELVDWQIRPGTGIDLTDSLVLRDIPRFGERMTLRTDERGCFQITSGSSSPLLRRLSDLEWGPLPLIERTWFAWKHRVVGRYGAGERSATVYWHRAFVNQKDVGITLQLSDPNEDRIGWFLIFRKK